MLTVNEIASKNHFDKRQTGQLFVRMGGGGGDFRKTKFANKPESLKEFKNEVRNRPLSKPNDHLANGDAKRLREIKALVLQDLRSIEAYVKKINDVKSIRNQIERIYPRMIGYLK